MLMTLGLFPSLLMVQNSSTKVGDARDSSQHAKGTDDSSQLMNPELENDSVKVLRIVMGPHEKVPMHEISPRLIVWVTDGRLRLTFPDGKTQEEVRRAGETEWFGAQTHAGENLGGKPIELIAVIPKR
jgi:quercetin dioxygenase-like cupin family protein